MIIGKAKWWNIIFDFTICCLNTITRFCLANLYQPLIISFFKFYCFCSILRFYYYYIKSQFDLLIVVYLVDFNQKKELLFHILIVFINFWCLELLEIEFSIILQTNNANSGFSRNFCNSGIFEAFKYGVFNAIMFFWFF